MTYFNKPRVKQLFICGLMACGMVACLSLGRTVLAADAPDSPPSTSPAPPAPLEKETPDAPGGKMREGMQKFRQACEADVKRFCPNVKPGGGRIVQCLDEHAKEVSSTCAQMLEKREQRQQKK